MRHDGNYIYKPLAITQDKRLTPIEQDYLCLIAQLQNQNGCTASNSYFAQYFGVKRSTSTATLSQLKHKNFIETSEKKSGGKTVERTIVIVDADSRKVLLKDGRNTQPLDGRKLPSGMAGNSSSDGRKQYNHTLDIQEKNTFFEQFWTAYPKKVSKAQAHKVFTKLNPDEVLLDAMLTALAGQRNSDQWLKNDGQYIPYPATWLGGRRWEDQLDESSSGCCMTREFTEEEADALYRQAGLIK